MTGIKNTDGVNYDPPVPSGNGEMEGIATVRFVPVPGNSAAARGELLFSAKNEDKPIVVPVTAIYPTDSSFLFESAEIQQSEIKLRFDFFSSNGSLKKIIENSDNWKIKLDSGETLPTPQAIHVDKYKYKDYPLTEYDIKVSIDISAYGTGWGVAHQNTAGVAWFFTDSSQKISLGANWQFTAMPRGGIPEPIKDE